MDPGLGGGRQGFIVLAQPPAPSQPSQRPLHHPSPRQHLKVMAVLGTLHDLHHPAGPGHDPINQLPGVAPVSPDQLQAGESSGQLVDDQFRPVPVLDIGRMHHYSQQHSHGVYHDVPLSYGDLLIGVIAVRPPFFVVFTLWLSMIAALGVGFLPSASRTMGRSVSWTRSQVPSLVHWRKYLAEVFVQRLPRRQVVGDHPPRATGAQHVQDAVDHLLQVHRAGPSSRPGWRERRKQEVPLFISQVAGI